MNTMHHHYWDTVVNESVCVECDNATDYCLEEHVRVSSDMGLAMYRQAQLEAFAAN